MGFFRAIFLVLVQFFFSFRQRIKSFIESILFLTDKTTERKANDPDKSLHFFLYGADVCNKSTSCCESEAPMIAPMDSETTMVHEKGPCEETTGANSPGGKPPDMQNLGNFRTTSRSSAHKSPSFQGRMGYMKGPTATEIGFYSLSNRDTEYSASQQSDKSNHSSVQRFSNRDIGKTSCENKDLDKGKSVLEINHMGSCHVTAEASNQVSTGFCKPKPSVNHQSLELQKGNHQRRSYSQQHPRGSSRGLQSDCGRRKSDSDHTFQRYSWRRVNSNSEDCLHVSSGELFSPYVHQNRAHPKGLDKNKPWESPTVAITPVFGDWDERDPRSGEGFTYMFERIKEEREILSSKFPDLLPFPVDYKSPPEKQQKPKTSALKIFCCCGFKKKEWSAR